jgi:hypothetical protein
MEAGAKLLASYKQDRESLIIAARNGGGWRGLGLAFFRVFWGNLRERGEKKKKKMGWGLRLLVFFLEIWWIGEGEKKKKKKMGWVSAHGYFFL